MDRGGPLILYRGGLETAIWLAVGVGALSRLCVFQGWGWYRELVDTVSMRTSVSQSRPQAPPLIWKLGAVLITNYLLALWTGPNIPDLRKLKKNDRRNHKRSQFCLPSKCDRVLEINLSESPWKALNRVADYSVNHTYKRILQSYLIMPWEKLMLLTNMPQIFILEICGIGIFESMFLFPKLSHSSCFSALPVLFAG